MPTFIEVMTVVGVGAALGWAGWITANLGGKDSEIFCLTLRLNRAEREMKVLREDYKHQYRMSDADWEQDIKDLCGE